MRRSFNYLSKDNKAVLEGLLILKLTNWKLFIPFSQISAKH